MRRTIRMTLFMTVVFSILGIGISQVRVKADTDITTTTSNLSNTEQIRQTVTTYPDNKITYLYDSEGKAIENVLLDANTNLVVDASNTINGEAYYRVATDRWVKASDVYVYKMSLLTIKAKGTSYVNLVDARGNMVTNRALSSLSKWKIDKVAEIDNKKYYRVATNEFVSAKEVNIIK